ncbi:MAG: type III-A CRISPR-associated RAMP protein Csm4, partial [Bryobacteraceae bacterium]
MQPGLVFRFRPSGPWRIGPDDGARDGVKSLLHSDALYSALTQAMARLGRLEEWLQATVLAQGDPALVISSCFPYLDEVHLVVPPASLWPPPPSPRLRWEGARFVPLSLVNELLSEQAPSDEAWRLDGPSACLLPADMNFPAPGPFRPARRWRAAVDRLSGQAVPYETACLEFADGGGFWALAVFRDEEAWAQWNQPLRGALQLLADSGLGGERKQGWGHSLPPEFIEIEWPDTLLTAPLPEPGPGQAGAYWLLSLFVPADPEAIEWTRSRYTLVVRGGRVESPQGWGMPKKFLRMVSEGSVLHATGPLRGACRDV